MIDVDADHKLVYSDDEEITYDEATSYGGSITPKFIVIHYTAGNDIEASKRYLDKIGLSAHLFIERNGNVIQTVPFNRKAYHAGRSFWRGYRNLNDYSIGIELSNYGWLNEQRGDQFRRSPEYGLTPWIPAQNCYVGDHPNGWPKSVGWQRYTDGQLIKCEEICRVLLQRYPSIVDIVGHDLIAPERKTDPGPAFPDKRFTDLLDQRPHKPELQLYEVMTSLNIRGGPGTHYEKIAAALPEGTLVDPIMADGDWLFVSVMGKSLDGWVHGGYLRVV